MDMGITYRGAELHYLALENRLSDGLAAGSVSRNVRPRGTQQREPRCFPRCWNRQQVIRLVHPAREQGGEQKIRMGDLQP